jgi:hypothetical protein
MRKQIVGMVLAGGRVDELSVLTAQRPRSAVPFWGMYRWVCAIPHLGAVEPTCGQPTPADEARRQA